MLKFVLAVLSDVVFVMVLVYVQLVIQLAILLTMLVHVTVTMDIIWLKRLVKHALLDVLNVNKVQAIV